MNRLEAEDRLAKEFAGYKGTLNELIDDIYVDFYEKMKHKDIKLNKLSDALEEASEKVEMFEDLIGMGLIDKESLDEIGYKG